MPRPDPALERRLHELEARASQLALDNQVLAERQVDATLLGLISQALTAESQPLEVLRAGLERIAVLLDLPACVAGPLDDGGLTVWAAYLARSDAELGGQRLPLARWPGAEFAGEPVLFQGTDLEPVERWPGPLARLGPAALLVVPAPSRLLPRGAVIFAETSSATRLRSLAPLLQRAVEAVGARIDNVSLVGELRQLNAALEERVAERTRALVESERQLRQSQKLEAIGRLAGGVAHDFNNLLTVILGSAAVLEEELAAGRAPQLDDVEQIREAGHRARDLTHQLLAFARKQVIAPVALDLNRVMRSSERLLRRVIGEDVALEVRAAPGLWTTRADPGQLEQVLLNLAVNARDAMPGGGRLTLETCNARDDLDHADLEPSGRERQWVRMVVRDTGTGMSPEVQAHLFEPFFTTKEVGKGTGLGLSTVHGIVTQAGGHLHVESAPGHGSSFTICLPGAAEAAADLATAEAPAPGGEATGSETILVVEDDAVVRRLTVQALADAGYRVLVAEHGAEGLEVAAREPGAIHLVVTDVVMPGLGGRAMFQQLRLRRAALRALFVSGYPREIMDARGLPGPGVELLPKPFTGAVLRARVRALLDLG